MLLSQRDRKIVRKFFQQYATYQTETTLQGLQVIITEDLSGFWRWIMESTGDTMENIPFWSIVWPGGRGLARYIFENPEVFAGKRVLEPGCGSGLASVAAARVGASVVACDQDPRAIYLAWKMARLNDVRQIEIAINDPLTEKRESSGSPSDIYIFGDMFYEESLARDALAFMRQKAAQGATCIAADPGRFHRPRSGYTVLARYRVDVPVSIEGVRQRDVEILQVH